MFAGCHSNGGKNNYVENDDLENKFFYEYINIAPWNKFYYQDQKQNSEWC